MQEGCIKIMVTGMICLWYGSILSIPAGYVLCDGNNSTPDLRNKFIVGAGDTYAVDATGGAVNHNHTFTSNTHYHEIGGGAGIASGAGFSDFTSSGAVTGTTDNENGLPPYHALAYIMKT